jgi:predicted amidohydrolase YtcJ
MVALVCGTMACAGPSTASRDGVDLVLTNGKIVTVDDALPEAEAVAISGDRIIAVGTSSEIDVMIGEDTEVVDLEGRLAIPSFIEGHGHYVRLGESKTILDLTVATSWQDMVDIVAEAVASAPPGAWIEGAG